MKENKLWVNLLLYFLWYDIIFRLRCYVKQGLAANKTYKTNH